VTAHEFETFCKFSYQGMYNEYKPTVGECMALLSIASIFNMKQLHTQAISHVKHLGSTMPPVDKIFAGNRFGVDGWVEDGVTELCVRLEPIDDEEAKKIGIETFAKLMRARELFRSREVVLPKTSPCCKAGLDSSGICWSCRRKVTIDQVSQLSEQRLERLRQARTCVDEIFCQADGD